MSLELQVLQQLEVLDRQYRHYLDSLADPDLIKDPKAYTSMVRKQRELEPLMEAYEAFLALRRERKDLEIILKEESDPELLAMAREELPSLRLALEEGLQRLQQQLVPKDPFDEKNCILEIRAGTGGEEAALFAAEMFRAYKRFGERHGWRFNIGSANETGIGGLKEVVCVIEGSGAYGGFRFESGTHRVQRIPQTETQGRVHTSAITVAVLPEAEEMDFQLADKDIRVDTYRSSGAGGQHVNTTDSAVRLTHLPTGLVVTCQDEKSQIKNREKAMRVMRAQLFERQRREQEAQQAAQRKQQVGSGDRSEKIRTYNFPQGRVTDHRTKVTLYRLTDVMNGDFDELISACRQNEETQRLAEQSRP